MENDMDKNAISPLERATKLDNKNIDFLKSLAEAYIKNDALDQAITIYEQALEMNELDKTTHLLYATALYERGTSSEAIEHLDFMQTLFDDDNNIPYIKAAFLFGAGNRTEGFITLGDAIHKDKEGVNTFIELYPDMVSDTELINFIEGHLT
jgi:tetratricopeptide (TPR) repeat protein